MKSELITFMSRFTELSDEEAETMIDFYPVNTYKKGEALLQPGQIAQDSFLVLSGCIRKYCVVEGEEKTIDFYTEEQVAGEFESMSQKSPSKYYLVCLEESRIARINSKKEEEYYQKFPRFEELSRAQMEAMMGENLRAYSTFITSSPEQRYLELLENRPQLTQRIPQHLLASYLGVTPESLSRIKKRIAKK